MSRLLDAFHAFTADAKANLVPTKKLITDLVPVLQSQQVSSDAIRRWALNLAQLTGQLTGRNDASVRAIIEQGPGRWDKRTRYSNSSARHRRCLANLVSLGEVGVTTTRVSNRSVAIPQGVPSWRRSPCPTWAVPTAGSSFNTSTLNSRFRRARRVLAGVGPPRRVCRRFADPYLARPVLVRCRRTRRSRSAVRGTCRA